jgi:hypothetical protein
MRRRAFLTGGGALLTSGALSACSSSPRVSTPTSPPPTLLTARRVRDIGERELREYTLSVREIASGLIPRAFALEGSSPLIKDRLPQSYLPASYIPTSYDQKNRNVFFGDGSAQLNPNNAVSFFMELNKRFISKISYLTPPDRNIKAVFCGGADGRPVKDHSPYRRDSVYLRNVVINENYYKYYAVERGDQITNEMIAVLRAHSIRLAYEETLGSLNDEDVFYNARTFYQEGAGYKYGRMDFNIPNVFRDI